MKMLSIWGPYAQLIGIGVKDAENRSWGTSYRGPLAIHCTAGSWKKADALALLREYEGRKMITAEQSQAIAARLEADRGKIIAVVELTGSCKSDGHRSPWAVPGGKLFELARARLVEPVEFKGARGLVDLPGGIAAGLAPMPVEEAESFEVRFDRLLNSGTGYVVTDRSEIHHETELRGAATRFKALRDLDLAPSIFSCKTKEPVSYDTVRAYSPHKVLDASGRVLGDSEAGERPRDVSRLAHALNQAHRQCWRADEKRFAWPHGKTPIVVNGWTQERLELGEACKVAARGHRG